MNILIFYYLQNRSIITTVRISEKGFIISKTFFDYKDNERCIINKNKTLFLTPNSKKEKPLQVKRQKEKVKQQYIVIVLFNGATAGVSNLA